MAYFFLVLGVLVFMQSIFVLIKGDSTKSVIPIFEKIAIYEKQKMGNEWYKEQKTGNVSRLVLSGLMFLQSYMYRDLTKQVVEIDYMFLLVIVFFVLVFMNVSLIIRFKKIDGSNSELDFKNYTRKSNLMGGAFGIYFLLSCLRSSSFISFQGHKLLQS